MYTSPKSGALSHESRAIDHEVNILLIYECGESPYAEGRPVSYRNL